MRKLTPRLAQYYKLAKLHNLACPLGCAVRVLAHVTNNGGAEDLARVLRIMQHTRLSTARRWSAHYRSGGSTKALRYTVLQWHAVQARKSRQYRASMRKIVQQNIGYAQGYENACKDMQDAAKGNIYAQERIDACISGMAHAIPGGIAYGTIQ